MIVLRDGTKLAGKFLEKRSEFIVIEGHGKVMKNAIRSFIICRGPHSAKRTIA